MFVCWEALTILSIGYMHPLSHSIWAPQPCESETDKAIITFIALVRAEISLNNT